MPEEQFSDYQQPEETIPRSPGHHAEWINSCKGGPPAMANFDYAARLTETVLLGIVALRAGRKIEWDAKNMRVKNLPEADRLLCRAYPQGWEI